MSLYDRLRSVPAGDALHAACTQLMANVRAFVLRVGCECADMMCAQISGARGGGGVSLADTVRVRDLYLCELALTFAR